MRDWVTGTYTKACCQVGLGEFGIIVTVQGARKPNHEQPSAGSQHFMGNP